MNKFEKYIQENKQKLEPDQIDAKVWLSIENEILRKSKKSYSFFIKTLAAAAVILVGTLLMYGSLFKPKQDIEARLIERYNLGEYKFTQQVSLKEKELSTLSIPKDKLADFQILLQQLEFLNGQFQDYTDYIEQNGYQEFIGNQIINHYKSKIKLLDKIQSEIEKINYYENKIPSNSEKVEINI